MPLLTASAEFSNEIRVDAPPGAVLAVLADPRALIRLNPLVVGVAQVEPDTYVVTDELRLLGVPFRLDYRVRWRRDGERIETEVEAALATRLRNSLRVEPDGAGARVVEHVRFTAPRLLVGYTRRTASAAHVEMLGRLKQQVEAGAGRDGFWYGASLS